MTNRLRLFHVRQCEQGVSRNLTAGLQHRDHSHSLEMGIDKRICQDLLLRFCETHETLYLEIWEKFAPSGERPLYVLIRKPENFRKLSGSEL